MAMLIVGGVTVLLANVEQPTDYEPVGGEIVRMFNGTPLSTVRAYKRLWPSLTTILMTDANASTLRAQLVSTTLPVAVSGDLTGSVNVIPQLKSYAAVNVRGNLYRRVVFGMLEA